jgi:hypothetical protein
VRALIGEHGLARPVVAGYDIGSRSPRRSRAARRRSSERLARL